jgi:hypothetical protein
MSARCPMCKRRADDDVLCSTCLAEIEVAVGDIPALVEDLELTVTRQGVGADLARRAAGGHPLPFASGPAIDEARRCVGVLDRWADHIAGCRSLAGDITARARRSSLAILDRRAWFEIDPQAPLAAAEVLQIREALRRAVDRPATRVHAGRCGAVLTVLELDVDDQGETLTPRASDAECDGAVYAEPGDPLALCRSCGVGHHVVERRRFLIDEIEEALLPLDEILAALPILTGCNPRRDLVRQWRKRRRLVPASITTLGVELYRGGDVLALARPRKADDEAAS